MGINIGIKVMDAPNASCRALRSIIIKVHLSDPSGFESGAIYDEFVPYDAVKTIFADWESFVKRNRINEDADAVYLEKIKKADDLEKLKPVSVKRYTGWIDVSKLSEEDAGKAVSSSSETVNGWDCLGFDEMGSICAACPLSWDKGRGCMGAFGPDNSLLPGIAEKHGCGIIASVPQAVKEGRIFDSKEAERLLNETSILKEALPGEGKMMVRRYSGPLDRLEAVARISMDEGCGFFFFRSGT